MPHFSAWGEEVQQNGLISWNHYGYIVLKINLKTEGLKKLINVTKTNI